MSQRVKKGRNFCFTLNNPERPLDWAQVPEARYSIYQLEKGEQGTSHFQGYVEFNKPLGLKRLKEILPAAHWENRRGTREEARDYCMKKDQTYVDGPWSYGDWSAGGQGSRTDLSVAIAVAREHGIKRMAEDHPEVYVKYAKGIRSLLEVVNPVRMPEPEGYVLGDMQKEILEKLKGPILPRRIFWIWSHESETGKTSFFKYVCSKLDVAIAGIRLEDTLYAYDGEKILWFDIPREQPLDSYLCSMLESLSDGKIFLSGKYESKKKLVHAHIVVSTNREPIHHRLPSRLEEYHFPVRINGEGSQV